MTTPDPTTSAAGRCTCDPDTYEPHQPWCGVGQPDTPPVMSMTSAALRTRAFIDRDALREHLDVLNESGVHPVAVGIDSCPQPFLITLVGPYAENEDVFFDSPWQGDVDYGEMVDGVFVSKQPRCDECRAMSHGIEDLRFPVTVLVQGGSDGA